MSITYINGKYLPHNQASISVNNRGYNFADGVYEVAALHQNTLLDKGLHFDRLQYSLKELEIPMPVSRNVLNIISNEVIRRNNRSDGLLYIQVTRGEAPRFHVYNKNIKPSLQVSLLSGKLMSMQARQKGAKVITAPDIRWGRCDIKSISLLPNILSRNEAAKNGCFESWQYNAEGFITEGSLSNAFIIKDKTIYTHPANSHILGGITRKLTLNMARNNGIKVVEQAFHKNDLQNADEAFLTASSPLVMPVMQIDDIIVNNGEVGEITAQLMQLYNKHVEAELCNPAIG